MILALQFWRYNSGIIILGNQLLYIEGEQGSCFVSHPDRASSPVYLAGNIWLAVKNSYPLLNVDLSRACFWLS